MSKEIYTDLEENKINNYSKYNLVKINTINYMQIVPDSHIFTDLAQILESCKHTIHCKELIPILENSIKQGYKIIKE